MCHIFFRFFCCVLVGCLVSYCAYFLSLVFSLYYNFFSWKNFISGKLCANIAPQFYSFPQNVLKRHEPKHLANGETNNNLQNGQQFVVTPFSIQTWSQSVEISEISNLFSQPLPQREEACWSMTPLQPHPILHQHPLRPFISSHFSSRNERTCRRLEKCSTDVFF